MYRKLSFEKIMSRIHIIVQKSSEIFIGHRDKRLINIKLLSTCRLNIFNF